MANRALATLHADIEQGAAGAEGCEVAQASGEKYREGGAAHPSQTNDAGSHRAQSHDRRSAH